MARKKSERREIEISPERAAQLRRLVIQGLIASLFIGVLAVGFHFIKKYVREQVVMPDQPPTIVIKNKPRWMSDYLAQRIAATARPVGLHSAFDHDMLVNASKALSENPWISKVYSVRRAFREKPGDTLEIDCEYRVPTALVKWNGAYWLVDREGVKLPEKYDEADKNKIVKLEDGRYDIRIIEGVRHAPPDKGGKKWIGDDLTAGLEMVALLSDKTYAQQIDTIDVSTFGDSRKPHVVLMTTFDPRTTIYWGRTASELDKDPFMEVSTNTKLDEMSKLFTQFGRVDAGRVERLDLRWDGGPQALQAGGPVRNDDQSARTELK